MLLLRHGETQWSRDGRHTGRTDIPLTTAGEAQARALRPALAALHPVAVLTSPLARAVRTAELAGLHAAEVDPDLAEWDYGDYEGISTAEIRRTAPGWTVWAGPVPGGETLAAVAERADRVLERIARSLAAGDVVVVGHGHVNRVLAARWVGLPARCGQLLALDTATVCLLGHEHEQQVIRLWNAPAAALGQL